MNTLEESIELCPNLFVYGTLKRNFGNHRVLEEGEYLQDGRISSGKFTMLDLGAFPALVQDKEGTDIHGELYRVNTQSLRSCDWLEGYPSFYNREVVDVNLSVGNTVKAWVYFLSEPRGVSNSIESGEWK